MKNKFKIIGASLGVASTVAAPLAVLTSCGCSKNFTDTMYNEILSEFSWMCTQYRETFYNRKFCDALVTRIHNWGYEVHIDPKYVPTNPEDAKKPFGYNFYFDMPSNTDGIPMIGLQAHTDMVCKSAEDNYDWETKGTPTVIEEIDGQQIMHSKDWQTSIGADDGIGVAIMLALAKHPNSFKHGVIRCLFTVDEEDGDSGANSVSTTTFDGCDYLINLDCEHATKTGTSCGGCLQAGLDINACETSMGKTPTPSEWTYTLKINGLLGGHSGHILHENRLNGIKAGAKIVQTLMNTYPDKNIRFIEAYEGNEPQGNLSSGSIPSQVSISIGSDEEISDIETIFNNTLSNELDKHTVEDKKTVLEESWVDKSNILSKGITNEFSKILCDIFLDETDDTKLDGIIDASTDPEHPDLYTKCCNIGTFRIGSSVYPNENDGDVYVEAFYRSKTKEDFEPNASGFMKRFFESSKTHFTDDKWKDYSEWLPMARNPVWEKEENNPTNKLIKAAANNFGYEMEDEDILGWLEMGSFAEKRPGLHMGTLGPELKDVHTVREILYVDTIKPMVNMLIYALEHGKELIEE